MKYRIGVDVGGTNTDGVLIDPTRAAERSRGVLAFHKVPTTSNVSEGIEAAIRQVLHLSASDPSEVACVSIGTTAFINAVLEADPRRLCKVAVIRICGPYTRQAPPFLDFPRRLKRLMDGHIGYIDGGIEIDGRPIVPISEEQIQEQCEIIKSKGLFNIVLSGVFSPLDNGGTNEYAVRDTIVGILGPAVNVVCSRDVGQLGLIERENASILNASILPYAQRTIRGFSRAMLALNIAAPVYITQNDGSLTTAAKAAKLPIRTFASGPTNSMRGASFLAGLDHQRGVGQPAIVIDVGGTTTDIGVLLPTGYPRQAASYIEIAGVRTNFAMADVQSIAFGGGSKIRQTDSGAIVVGPDSVGHQIQSEGMVFGGNTLTTTDIIVAAGKARVGDPSTVSHLDRTLVEKSIATINKHLERIIDRMKVSPEAIDVLLVGGGGIIAPDKLSGISQIIRPPFFDVTNAVGAAMAKVSYEIDTIVEIKQKSLPEIMDKLKSLAIEGAIAAGAEPSSTRIVEVNNLPVNYVTNQSTRVIIKAAGDLSPSPTHILDAVESERRYGDEVLDNGTEPINEHIEAPESPVDVNTYRPTIRADQVWVLSEIDLEWIGEGCNILGAGGGGPSYPAFLMARQLLREGKSILVVDAVNVPQDALFARCCFMGSPSVSSERIQGGVEILAAMQALKQFMGFDDFFGTISDEIGGGNGIQPLIMSGMLGKVTIDADLMGRAYPHMWQSLPGVFGIENGLFPVALADGVGNALVMGRARNGSAVETVLRGACTEMGSKAAVTFPPLTRLTCQKYGVAHTVSQAWRMGRAVALCRQQSNIRDVVAGLLELQNGACLFTGKIVDVRREVRKGFTWGEVVIAPLSNDELEYTGAISTHQVTYGPDARLIVPFQNENIYAYIETSGSEAKKIVAVVPDLITVLDSQQGVALGTPDYRYGLRVTVIALAGDEKWSKTEAGLNGGGPKAFGLDDILYKSVGEYKEPRGVIEEYA
ncbi:hypothetical protein CCMSSC00406_0009989 [Pleurotus cornucopiae]|uniref:Uncharacterized protein n=1 Tax=Pleurotus cornucopiae TaxID=5321 RepID=A0ACB7IUY7_PLECO|nr:hypothetical protein CCMSSC00406_0009989 [Pleurotus cornucopiae]